MNINSSIICFGEILWDVLPDKKVPGGAPMNVALHLWNLGLNANFAGRIGEDSFGDQLKSYLDSLGFTKYLLQRDPEHSTGIAEVDMTDPGDPQYHFPKCAWDFLEMDDSLEKMVKKSEIIVHGSLVARSEKSYNTLMRILDGHNQLKVFDINLRKPNYSPNIIEQLLKRANVVKMNENELKVLSHWFFDETNEETLLEKISERYGCDILTVTKGADGASLFYNGRYYQHPGYRTKIVDSIGAGDAFLAGMIKGLLTDRNPAELISFSCAMGAYTVTKAGGTPEYDLEEVYKIMQGGS